MGERLRVLIVEDSEREMELLVRELKRSGYDPDYERVETKEDMQEALTRREWDVVVSDWSMPRFSGLAALSVLQASGFVLPFIIVSGTIGEDVAVQALQAGAHDFLVKDRLGRLASAIERERRELEIERKRREAEAALRSSEELFRTLVASMGEMVLLIDRNQRIRGVFGRLVLEGLEREAYSNKTPDELLGPVEAAPHREAIERALRGESVLYEWTPAVSQSKRTFQISLTPRRKDDCEVVGLVGVVREITEQKRLDQQLLLTERMASLGMLAAGVAHEINNPLTALVGSVEFAIEQIEARMPPDGDGDALADVCELLRHGLEAAARIRTVTGDLRLFSRGENADIEQVDVHRVLDSTIRMAASELRDRARLVRRYGEIPAVVGDESRLGQVFLNLIVNAAQAIPPDREVDDEIAVSTWLENDRVCVEVRDTGIGMGPETVERLFTPFFTTKPKGKGTGLGLSICQRIVLDHGGEIVVSTAPGRGTAFRVVLPAQTRSAPPEHLR